MQKQQNQENVVWCIAV